MATTKKIWAGYISSPDYLQGLITLHSSLRSVRSKYTFVALYTERMTDAALRTLDQHGISRRLVPYLSPSSKWDSREEIRWNDIWSKLTIFDMTDFERIVLLDLDMVVMQNMDELMDVPLNDTDRLFAATPQCTCNPAKCEEQKTSWPSSVRDVAGGFWEWEPTTCVFTPQHANPKRAHLDAPIIPEHDTTTMPNAGLLVVKPNATSFARIKEGLQSPEIISKCTFPEQSLLKFVFPRQWAPLPYVYNAIKTMRWEGVHDTIWSDSRVKNLHLIGRIKPWDETSKHFADANRDPTHLWWWRAETMRLAEKAIPATSVFAKLESPARGLFSGAIWSWFGNMTGLRIRSSVPA